MRLRDFSALVKFYFKVCQVRDTIYIDYRASTQQKEASKLCQTLRFRTRKLPRLSVF